MKTKINTPNREDIHIKFTQTAMDQLQLIKDNDYTIEGLCFRLKIEGKGCHGFDYALGFSERHQDDLTLHIPHSNLDYVMDPFTAFYCQSGVVDYIQDFENNAEGFHYENDSQKSYRGKFFKDESKAPELK